jgi:hypothetical protein
MDLLFLIMLLYNYFRKNTVYIPKIKEVIC